MMPNPLDHEKLDVYQIKLKFVQWATDLIAELADSPDTRSRRIAEVIDQLDRAGVSMLLNTAEGNGRRKMKSRAKFFDDARGSAAECSACLDALVAKRACLSERIEQGKDALIRIVSMLTKLVERFSTPMQVHEQRAVYGVEDEYEEEDEDEITGD